MNNVQKKISHFIPSVIAVLFFLSGATSLAYQTIWFRRFATLWGSSTLAMAAVVASFLGGLALGAYAAGRLVRRTSSPLKWYGILEILIGIWALLIPLLVAWSSSSFVGILGHLPSNSLVLFLVRTLIAFLIIGVPCLCMGGTLPLLVEFQSKGIDSVGHTTGLLYGINTLGATAGCYLTGFHLLPAWGSWATNLTMTICNITIGVAAVLMARVLQGERSDTSAAVLKPAVAECDTTSVSQRPLLVLVASALTGCAALILEMVWVRQLATILGGSTYTFTATLCLVLLGIGIGGLLYRRIECLVKTKELFLDAVVLVIAAICFTTVFAQFLIPKLCLLSGAMQPFRDSDLGNGFICSAMAIILELLPAIGMGILFPSLAQTAKRGVTNAGDVVGVLYLWNTVGAALGAVLSFSLLVPLVGTSGAVAVAIGAYLAAAVLLEIDAGMFGLPRISFKLIFGATLAIVLARSNYPLATNMGMYLYGPDKNPGSHAKLLYYKEGRSCNVLVTESRDGGRSLRVNGKVDASTDSDQSMQLGCAYLTRFLRPHAKNVCVIGLGSGTTAGASLLFPNTSVTCFELEPAVYEGAGYFTSINHSPWKSDRFEIVFDDARGAMNRTNTTYDLIISEPSNPWIAGVSNLYTREFYETAKRRLNSRGIVAQWVQTYDFTLKEFSLILRTMQRVFPHIALIRISEGDTILVASPDELSPNAEDIESAQNFVDSVEDVGNDLVTYFGTRDVRSLLLKHFVLDEEGLKRLQRNDDEQTINTDINMRLEFDAPRQLFRQQIPDNENVAFAINKAINAEWYEACFDQWGCSERQVDALADALETIITFQDDTEIQRMTNLCRRLAPDEPFFQIVDRIELKESEQQTEYVPVASLSENMMNRLERVGVILWRKKQYARAIGAFHTLVALRPHSATSWMNLAVNYEALKQNKLAADAARKAVSIDPLNSFVQSESRRFKEVDSKKDEVVLTEQPEPENNVFIGQATE